MNKFTEKLNKIIESKTNICFSLDIPEWDNFFEILLKVVNKICIVKIHLDIMENQDFKNINKLSLLSQIHNFMIWEDRKFCDIAHTHKLQLDKLLKFNINFVSINPSGGIKSIEPFFDKIGIFILSELSCEGNIINKEYTQNCLDIVNNNNKYISGIINQNINKSLIHKNILSLTPGIHKNNKKDNMGQQYRNPNELSHKPDIFIVGRSIYNSENPEKTLDDLLN